MGRYLARLHGYVSGDGSAGIYSYPYKKVKPHLNIKIDDSGCLDKILEAFETFDYRPSVSENQGKYENWFTVQAQNERIVRKVLSVGPIGSYGWRIPDFEEKASLREWVSAFFDSEASVVHPNKEITLESVNSIGLNQLKKALERFGIASHKKYRENRDVYLLRVCGHENLERFKMGVAFYHSEKKEKLKSILSSYQKYFGNSWRLPNIKDEKAAQDFLTDFFAHRGYFRVKKQKYGSFEIGLHNKEVIAGVNVLLQNYFDIVGASSITPDKQGRSWIWISKVSELKKLLESGLLSRAPEKEKALDSFLSPHA